MYDLNLYRLMENCCAKIDDDIFDELKDYLTQIEADLNTLNIDDLVVNGLGYGEITKEIEEDYYILSKDDNNQGYYI